MSRPLSGGQRLVYPVLFLFLFSVFAVSSPDASAKHFTMRAAKDEKKIAKEKKIKLKKKSQIEKERKK